MCERSYRAEEKLTCRCAKSSLSGRGGLLWLTKETASWLLRLLLLLLVVLLAKAAEAARAKHVVGSGQALTAETERSPRLPMRDGT